MTSFDSRMADALGREVPLRVALEPAWDDVLARAGSGTRPRRTVMARRRWPVMVVAAAAALLAILVATPAWALVRDVLPFWDQPAAPSAVKVEFSRMNVGHPAGMSPQAVSGDTREIEQAVVGGETKTLWVAPATGRFDFCWIWGPHLVGSCGSSAQPLGVTFTTIPPHEPSQPAQTTNIRTDSGYPENGVPLWVTGSAISASVSDVVIRFSDGSSVRPHTVWVSAPISTGFFAYDIPADQQSSEDHATEVDAYDPTGKLVSKQTITGG